MPYQIQCPRGKTVWCREDQLVQVAAPTTVPSAPPASTPYVNATPVARAGRIPVGSRVRLAPGRPSGDKLRTDEIGVLVTDDGSDRPYEVSFS